MIDRLRATLDRGPVLLDAALGTRLIARGLDLREDDPCLWNLAHPELVAALHRADVVAGARGVLSNTFGANRAWLARFGAADQVADLNRAGVALARAAAGPHRLVLGSIGPTAARLPGAYEEQAQRLAEAGVDALLLETHTAAEASLALDQIRPVVALPVLVSLIAWPDPLAATVRDFTARGARALGGNCQADMETALTLAEALRRATDLPLIVKPSAGLPETRPATPASFAAAVPRLLRLGPTLVGGCCGTTEAHLAALRAAGYDRIEPFPTREEGRP